MTDFSIGGAFSKLFGSEDTKPNFSKAKTMAGETTAQKTDLPNGDVKKTVVENEAKKPNAKTQPGAKIHVTKEYIKEHGTTIVGTKGNDVFIIDADVTKFEIKGNGGKDKVIIKKALPQIDFPKLPNE